MSKVIPLFQPGKSRDENEQFAQFIFEHYTRFFYRHFTYQGQFMPALGKNNTITKALQLSGGDVAGISPKTKESVYFEEKADSHQPVNCFLERYSNTKRIPPIDGWIKTSEATYLLYSFYWLPKAIDRHILDVFFWKFAEVQAWFWPREIEQELGKMYVKRNTLNRTGGYIVPLEGIMKVVPTKRYLIMPTGDDAIIKSIEPTASLPDVKSLALHLSSEERVG